VTAGAAHLDEARAQALLDGALGEAEAALAQGHAEACPRCAALVESFRALSVALDALPLPELPLDFTAAVLARVDQAERGAARERRTAVVVIAGALLALGVTLLVGGSGAWVPTAAHLADQLGEATGALRLAARWLPPVLGAVRLPLAVLSAALLLPLAYGLSRLTSPAPARST
jgi:anti-sigma factor RsiW